MSTRARARQENGAAPDALTEALQSEEAIATEATDLRSEEPLDAGSLLALYPLLRRPIPAGLIVSTPVTKGKPYPSTGVKSMQVQVNRMDAVLGATNWGWETEWFDNGKVAEVTVWIGPEDAPLVRRAARGGVNQASTDGNRYKGSETNAGKLAFARIGPGWEVYVGATDLDPDVSEDAAKAQEGTEHPGSTKLTEERADKLEQLVRAAGLFDHLPAKLRSFGVKALTDLDESQGMLVYEWTNEVQPQLAAET